MREEEPQETGKHPIEMTSDELLDYVVHPKVAAKLRERVRDEPPDDRDDSQE